MPSVNDFGFEKNFFWNRPSCIAEIYREICEISVWHRIPQTRMRHRTGPPSRRDSIAGPRNCRDYAQTQRG